MLKNGAFRELLTDGSPEITSKSLDVIVTLLQAYHINPVLYRPNLMGLVARFHRTWKDMVAIYVNETQKDWDHWVPFGTFAYNSARHTTTTFPPNELLMGRQLRAPDELLQEPRRDQIDNLQEFHCDMIVQNQAAQKIAAATTERDQARQARFYDRGARRRATFVVGSLVWVFRPPRGRGMTKLVH